MSGTLISVATCFLLPMVPARRHCLIPLCCFRGLRGYAFSALGRRQTVDVGSGLFRIDVVLA